MQDEWVHSLIHHYYLVTENSFTKRMSWRSFICRIKSINSIQHAKVSHFNAYSLCLSFLCFSLLRNFNQL